MSQADEPREGLAALLGDVLSEGAPDPELLARYADDPSALQPEERQMIERRLAESPEVRDQLRVLKRFDFSAAREARGSESRSWLSGALAWIRRLSEARPVLAWAPPIVVASLVLLLIYPGPSLISWLDRSEPTPPIVLAVAMPEYRAPEGATPRLRTGDAGVLPGGLSYMPRPLEIIALAPEHVGQTASQAPSLYWYLAEIPEGGVFEFWIAGEGSEGVPGPSSGPPAGEKGSDWVEMNLPAPSRPGLQRIRLSDYGVRLEAGGDYSWTVSFGPRVHASGWIERVELPDALATRLAEASLGQAPAIYAEAGLWYDALSSLQELIAAHPNAETLTAARWELLRQGGLGEVAAALALSDQTERERQSAPGDPAQP